MTTASDGIRGQKEGAPPPVPVLRRWLFGAAAVLLALLLALLVHVLSQSTVVLSDPAVLRLTQGQRLGSNALMPPEPPPGLAAGPQLPLQARASEATTAQWLYLPFRLEQDVDEAWRFSVGYRPSLLVYLDGRLLAQSVHPAQADQPTQEFQLGRQMLEASVPPAWLGRGAHLLQLRLGAPTASGTSLEAPRLGPRPVIEAQDRARLLWGSARAATMITALVVGLFLLLVWLSNREALVYALAGVHVLLLALLLSPYVLHEQPLPSPWWRLLLDAADVLAKGLMLAIIAALAQPPARALLRLVSAYVVLGLLIDGWAALQNLPWSDFGHPWPWWALGGRYLVLSAAAVLALRELWRAPQFDRLGTAILVLLSLLLWGYVSFFALVLPTRLAVEDVNVVAHAGWVLWVGALLQGRFASAARLERALRAEAARELQQRTQELQQSFEALQASEARRLAATERERLLQEMHDGLGAQLLSAKLNAQAGDFTRQDMVNTLESCIQEMRLTIDVLSVGDGDLGLLLASVRHRIEPTLRAAGLQLLWRVGDTPTVPLLEGRAGRELVRIVQEALSNVLHHARASRVTIGTQLEPGGAAVLLFIADDGCGMGAQHSEGHGTRSMRQRAKRLGVTLEWRSPPEGVPAGQARPGTEVWLRLPLKAS